MSDTILVERRDDIAVITLNRPEKRNALRIQEWATIADTLDELGADDSVRCIVLRGAGTDAFCAGADLRWMKRAADFTEDENYDDAMRLAGMLRTLDTLSKPSLVVVHGPTYGGGVGLISCCDIVLAMERAIFSLSEVKLGLVPAVISPYVVRAIGARAARRYFQSAERFDVREAHRIGLVHQIIDSDDESSEVIRALLQAGPNAQRVSKELISRVENARVDAELIEDTARTIAEVRASDEGKEGLRAFLDKRRSSWNRD